MLYKSDFFRGGKFAMFQLKTGLFTLLVVMSLMTTGMAAEKCIQAEGEAAIVNHDVPSARLEAVARAKWSAIEQTVGVEVKTASLVQNFSLVDDAIKTRTGGVIKRFNLTGQENRGDTLLVKIHACVEPEKAREAVSSLSLNNSIAVLIPSRKFNNEYEETNIVSETLIGKLAEQNYKVIDVVPTHTDEAERMERSMKKGGTLEVRSIMYKYLSNVIIVGKIDPSLSVRKGENIGYGISMPFNNVTFRMTYRIIAKNKDGNMQILTSGALEGKGLAPNKEDAAANGLKDLAEQLSEVVLEKVAGYIQDNVKKITVRVNNVENLDSNMEVKDILQQVVWVTGVEEKKMGEFIVSYPENTVYLANSLKLKGNLNVVNFSTYSIDLDYLQ